ncbi:ABC transporter permease [Williamsia sp. DF01-3]|nr:ABC transporter permease [Williamsia sp. DF01-3]
MTTSIIRDSSIVLTRELRPTVRDPFTVIFSLVQPLILLALFGPLLKDVPGAGDSGNVWNWFIPGVLAMIAIFGTSMTGSNLMDEIHSGSHERMLVTPLSRSSLLIGRALKEMVPLAAQAVIILLVGLPLGFDINLGERPSESSSSVCSASDSEPCRTRWLLLCENRTGCSGRYSRR